MTWLGRPGGRDLEMMSRPGRGLGKGRRSRLGLGVATRTGEQVARRGALTIGTAAAMIALAYAVVSQSGSNDLQHLEAHHPPMVRGGVESRVRTTMTTEGEVDVMRGIQDMKVGTKKKGDQSSSSPRKKPKDSSSQGFQSRGYPS